MTRRMDDSALQAILALAVVAVIGFTLIAIKIGEGFAIPVGIVGAISAAVILRGPVGQALAARLHGGSEAAVPSEEVLGELDELRGRVMELEERLDFTERLLTQTRDASALPKAEG
jgi:hypothetical protein